jgi:peptidyl-prolyl cis-trans isomerase C
MKKSFIAASLLLAATLAPLAAQAQNIAVVNGKPVPKARVDTIVSQVRSRPRRATSRCRRISRRWSATRSSPTRS